MPLLIIKRVVFLVLIFDTALIERLTPFEGIALKALEKGIKKGDFAFIKLFMEYRFGKPKEKIDLKQKTMTAPVLYLENVKIEKLHFYVVFSVEIILVFKHTF